MRLTHPIAGVPSPQSAARGLLEGLTPEQARAVTHGEGPLLLLAGPGAGKTRTLTHRAAYLLASGRARPGEILAVTFSVRAAGELRLRLADLLGETVARAVTAATFHSVCARLLREHASVFGRTERYTIYDQGDMRRVVDWLLSDADRGQIQQALQDCGQPASAEVLAEISRAKNLLLTPETLRAVGGQSGAGADRGGMAGERGGAAALERDGFRRSARVRRAAAGRAPAPPDLASPALALDPGRRVPGHQPRPGDAGRPARRTGREPVRGRRRRPADPWLASCRPGAHPRASPTVIPRRAEIVLGRNFRSRAEILQAAVSCVQHNEHRAPKALIAMRGTGGHVRVVGLGNEYQEAHWVAGQVADALATGTPPAEILALARTGYATEPLQHALAHHGIAHRVLGSLGLYERTEVRDALAYLTLLQNPRDAQALRRAIASPRRGVGTATVTRLITWARDHHGGDLIAAAARAGELDRVPSEAARPRLVEFGVGLFTCAPSSTPDARSATS